MRNLNAIHKKVEKEPNAVIYSIIPMQIEKADCKGNIYLCYAVVTVNSDRVVNECIVRYAVTDSPLMGMYHSKPSAIGGVGLVADRVVLAVPLLGFGFVGWGYAFVCLFLCLHDCIVHILIYSIIPFCYFFMGVCMDSIDGFVMPFSDTLQ